MSGKRRFRWARWGAAALVALALLAAAARLWLLEGWLRTIRIDGASMAPTLCGTHLEVRCSDCGIAFRVDGAHLPASGRLVCPNCGYRELEASAFPPQPGETVYVDRWPLLTGGPRRGDLVAFDDPLAGGLSVKRVAGIPGEKLSIRGGDLYADGNIVRKTLAELRQVALLVHDNDYLPRSLAGSEAGGFLRWRPDSLDSGWEAAGSGFRCQPAKGSETSQQPAWLRYVHWRCDASLTPRDESAAILDNDPYNQAEARKLNVVRDLLLACQVELPASGRLMLAVTAGGKPLSVELDVASGAIAAVQGSRKIAAAVSPLPLAGRRLSIELAHCDAQLLLAIGGRTVLRAPLNQQPAAPNEAAAPARLGIGCAAGTFGLTHLQVWRDLYLVEPRGTDRSWTMNRRLAADEFFMLGDNPAVSVDSRHWKGEGLPRAKLRGVVLLPGRKPKALE